MLQAPIDDGRGVGGMICVIPHGLQWKDAPSGYGPPKTLYNQFIRWSRLDVFSRIFAAFAAEAGTPERQMIYATHLKAHRTAASLLQKGACRRSIGRTKGDLNSKLHPVCDGQGRSIMLLLAEDQMSDHKGAAMMLSAMPSARELLADRGYNSNAFRAALLERGFTPCIPSIRRGKEPLPHDKTTYRPRHHIENMFGRLKGHFGMDVQRL